MPDWLWLVIIPGFVILVIYALRKKSKLESKLKEELTAQYGAENLLALDDKVKYYGLRSRGAIQPSELGAALAVTAETIHVRTWDYGKTVGFEIQLPVDRLHRYYRSNKFVTLGPGGKITGSGLLVLRYPDPSTGEPEELGLLLSQEAAVLSALESATGKPAED